jgi:cell division septation protein DedD
MMASKQTLFGGGPTGGLRAGPDDRATPGGPEAANQGHGDETGAQRGATHPGAAHPGDPGVDIDLLDDQARQNRRGVRSGIAIVAGLAVFVGILWFAYDWGMGQLEVAGLPVIVADTTPIKTRPADPGGIEVPNQNVAVLNDPVPDPLQPQVERLLPPPETPQLPQAGAPQDSSLAVVEELLGPPLESAAGPPTKMPDAGETLPSTELPAVPQAAVSVPEATPEPQAEVAPSAPEPAEAQVAVAAPTPAPTPAPVAPQVAALPAAQTGDYVVQLAALKAQASARPAWTRLQKAHPELLNDRDLAIQRVDLGDRGIFYRIQAGFFADRAGALALCSALKARGQDCLVAKR